MSVFYNRLTQVLLAIALALALISLDGSLGPLSFQIRRVIGMVTLVVAAFVSINWNQVRTRVTILVAIIAATVLVARAPSVPVAMTCFVVAVALISRFNHSEDRVAAIPAGLAQAGLSYVIGRLCLDLTPPLGIAGLAISELASLTISRFRGMTVSPSFSALGGPVACFASVYLVWRWRLFGGFPRLLAAVALLLVWFGSSVAIAPVADADTLVTFGRGAMVGVAILAIAIVFDASFSTKTPESTDALGSSRRRLILTLTALGALMVGVCLVGTSLFWPREGRKVLVHNRGGLDWDRPVFGRFGVFSGGMFGLLPVYCRAEGYDFGVIDKETIEPIDLNDTQVLMLINSPKDWPDREKQVILDFVERGGSLLVLGDHTDVFGLMKGFNPLIGEFGIRFQFDSAYKARETWRGCQAAAADAIALSWDQENPSVAVGASLELTGSARPLLTGRYGFSDSGVRENYVGSFLGNYRYEPGEKLGDVVLVATATRGAGRVMVWGDTSAFQGGMSDSYAKVVGPTLAWLTRKAAWSERPPIRWLASA